MTPQKRVYYGKEAPPLKDWGGRLPVAVIFPEPANMALSTLGWQAVYKILSACPDIVVERFFLDKKELLSGQCPRSEDSGKELKNFPLLVFSMNVEEEIFTFIAALKAADIPLQRKQRTDWPLVMAGGPLAFMNPVPLSPGVDIFFAGEAESGMIQVISRIATEALQGKSHLDCLYAIQGLNGVYLPGISKKGETRRAVLSCGSAKLVQPACSCFVSPKAGFRDMFLLEVNRGCPYGCRFCAAGFVYRPPRQAERMTLQAVVEEAKPKKVGLVGTALTDWPDLIPFLQWLNTQKIKFSLASLRADGLTDELLGILRKSGVKSITLALEAPSNRLRVAANKQFDEAAFLLAVERISKLRFHHLKLYLIVGWPGETREDYLELQAFMSKVDQAAKKGQGLRKQGIGRVTLNTSCLVPKPFTPLQWVSMASEQTLKKAHGYVKEAVKPYKGFKAKTDSPAQARLQALLARGDESVFALAELAVEKMSWKKALQVWPYDADEILEREKQKQEALPWECFDVGISREYLWAEWQKYRAGTVSRHCGLKSCTKCNKCGMGDFLRGDIKSPYG